MAEPDVDVKKLIKRVLSTKEFYERMGLERTASSEEIKKRFRKLSLLLHPDKCTLPGAEESFKAINQAYTVLSDPDKKKIMTNSVKKHNNHKHLDQDIMMKKYMMRY